MPHVYTSLAALLDHGCHTVIDVRSPSEYAEDHLPGAINLPVLNDAERAQVGTVYKQQSPFLARKIGAALVFQNTAAHIAGPLANHDGGWRPLVYCWRGGQRSGSFGWMLRQIGWRAQVLEGGYRTYRRLVKQALYDMVLPHRIVLLDGDTGTAKTVLLHRLAARGVQVIDLEGLANHRGSLLGGLGPQPSQKAFESALAAALAQADPNRPLLLEAESNKIGSRILPPALWTAMRTAPRIEVRVPLEARARYLAQAYADVLADGARLWRLLAPLNAVRGAAVLNHWKALIAQGDTVALSHALMRDHYDPAYARSRKGIGVPPLAQVSSDRLDDSGINSLLDQIESELNQIDINRY